MNVAHKFTIAICTLFLFGTLTFAQETAPPQNTAPAQTPPASAPSGKHQMHRDPAAMRLQMMSQRLNLTADQKAKIQPILQNEIQQARSIHQNASLTPDQQKAQMQQIHQAARDQVKQILTPEQVAQMGKGPGKGPGMDHGGPGHDPLAWMSKTLNLTDEQKTKLQPLFDGQHKQVQSVMQDSSLTPEQKHAKVEDIRKATHQQVMSVLTPEQQNQMKQMRGKHMHEHGEGAPSNAQPPAPPSA
jgi:Spy/CpxP family protein refolding chaperone